MLLDEKMMWDGQGPVFLGKYDKAAGRPDMGNLVNVYQVGCGTSALTTSPKIGTENINETCTGARAVLASRISSRELGVGLTAIQFDSRAMATAFYGEATAVAAGTVTDEPIAPTTAVGDFIFLRYPNVKNVVLTDSAAAPLVENTHYAVEDAATGRIRVIALPGAATIATADYEFEPHVHFSIFKTGLVEMGLIFCGINGKGQRARVTVPRINFSMGGDFSWIGDDNAELQLEGQALFASELQFHPQFAPGFGRVELISAPTP